MPIKSVLLFLIAGLLAAASPALLAQDNRYQIEIIVFEHLQLGGDNEVWVEQPERPDWQGAVQLAGGGEGAGGYLPLSAARQRMQGVYRVLRSSGEYRPLLHLTWEQPGLTPARARPVLLPSDSELIEGTVKLRRTRYLHVDLDLMYVLGSGPGNYVRLVEERRVKLNELHYFDHPLFGAIVQVTRAN
jgi:hypothetical protein